MTCSTCKHWEPKKSGDMAKHLLCKCALNDPWRYFPPQKTCSSHVPAPAAVVASRQAWIRKNTPISPTTT